MITNTMSLFQPSAFLCFSKKVWAKDEIPPFSKMIMVELSSDLLDEYLGLQL